jgi:hypothetical protein
MSLQSVPSTPLPDAATDEERIRVSRVESTDVAVLMTLCAEHAAQVAPEREAYGSARAATLELMEALFDPPLRAWAWIVEADGIPVGYAGASVGVSLLERAYYLNLESLYVRDGRYRKDLVQRLLAEATLTAERLGCLNLQWRVSTSEAFVSSNELPLRCTAFGTTQFVLPMGDEGIQ